MDSDDFRVPALKKLLADRDALLLQRLELRPKIMELMRQDNVIEQRLQDVMAAGRAFNFKIGFPTDPKVYLSRQALDAAMQAQRGRPWTPGDSYFVPGPPKAAIPTAVVENDPAPTTPAPAPTPVAEAEMPDLRIRDHVLNFLRQAGSRGAEAAAIRDHLATSMGLKTHPKTTGMTLYRLSKEGHVRREGRTWFFVEASAETKNPGADTPGPDNGIFD